MAEEQNSPPTRSREQRFAALRKANEIRIGRAQLKRALTDGAVTIEHVLANPPECARQQKVEDVLLAVPKYGPSKVARLLARCRVSPAKTIGGLSERQRQELLRHFRP